MVAILSFLLVTFASIIAVPVYLFCIEIFSAILFGRRIKAVAPVARCRKQVAVLVPAHNESAGLRATLDSIGAQLRPGDRLLVVADNCTDDTAEVARLAGAEVTQRHDPDKIGKGYALDFGLQYLCATAPEIIIFIDADCRLNAFALDHLAAACAATGRPCQALYLMTAPAKSGADYRVAEFAFRVKNLVRPLGLKSLSLPCQLMGTGMAFPRKIIYAAKLASPHIVEDLKLGLDLACEGSPPLFCPLAVISSQFPLSTDGATKQRERWEYGHISVIATLVPRAIYRSLTSNNFRLLGLALDAAIPPLTFLGLLVSLMFALSSAGYLLGLYAPAFILTATTLVGYILAILACWQRFGRDILPFTSISSVAFYVIAKLPLYRQIRWRGNRIQWIRTDREKFGENDK